MIENRKDQDGQINALLLSLVHLLTMLTISNIRMYASGFDVFPISESFGSSPTRNLLLYEGFLGSIEFVTKTWSTHLTNDWIAIRLPSSDDMSMYIPLQTNDRKAIVIVITESKLRGFVVHKVYDAPYCNYARKCAIKIIQRRRRR